MKRIIFLNVLIIISHILFGQTPGETVTDFDGNVYQSVILGNQTWLAENLKSTHYCDGTEIQDVVAYNNDTSLGDIYGLLYTWNAAMNGSITPGSQGVCPCGWHLPSDEEWSELELFLGGADIAGGKMKETGLDHWFAPNTGADNSSGLKILPGGEFDASHNPPMFRFLKEYAVFWTSTQINFSKARERALSYNDTKSLTIDWYKTLKYSIRCVKDNSIVAVENEEYLPNKFELGQNYPNPFNPNTTFQYRVPVEKHIRITLYDMLGNEISSLYNGIQAPGIHSITIEGSDIPSGFYYYQLESDDVELTNSCILVK
jgi:uncharacterized protein (TIGR02145 family)